MTWCRNESISDVPFQLDIAAVTARIEAGASHLYTAKLLNGVYFVMLLKWRMFPSFNSTLKSKYLLTPAPPDMFSNDKMQKKFVLLWMVSHQAWEGSPQKLESYWNNSRLVSWWWAEKFMKQIKIQLATPLYWGFKVTPPAMFLQQIAFQYNYYSHFFTLSVFGRYWVFHTSSHTNLSKSIKYQ